MMGFSRSVLVSVLLMTVVGCVNINEELLLNAGTKVLIVDETKDATINLGYFKGSIDTNLVRQNILNYTKDELAKRSIEVLLSPAPGAAKLVYKLTYVNIIKKEFEVGYSATFETADGKFLFNDRDEKNNDELDGALKQIAKRVARNVANSFKTDDKLNK